MQLETTRFASITVNENDIIEMPEGVLGFEGLRKFVIVDPGDDTFIQWFQSVEKPEIAFPILEPKVFRPDYLVKLSANEMRALELESVTTNTALVYSILTIPKDPKEMTANLKAPIVINPGKKIGRQVILQENEYSVRCSMYKELVALIMSAKGGASGSTSSGADEVPVGVSTVSLETLKADTRVMAL